MSCTETYLDEDAQDVFLSANQKAQRFILQKRDPSFSSRAEGKQLEKKDPALAKHRTDLSVKEPPKREGAKRSDPVLSGQGFGSIFWIMMIGLLILGAVSFLALRCAGAQKIF